MKRLVVEWADAVAENYAPRAMKGFGLDYDTLAAIKPDLVMISACLNGQTGPHKDYPGFGGQGAALSGYNWLTGWPDLEPVGPLRHDHRLPRAALRRRRARRRACTTARAPGNGVLPRPLPGRVRDLDARAVAARRPARRRDRRSATATARRERCRTARSRAATRASVDDRWVAIACWTDDEWARARRDHRRGRRVARDARRAPARAIDEVEAAVGAWTRSRSRGRGGGRCCRRAGIEAVPDPGLR